MQSTQKYESLANFAVLLPVLGLWGCSLGATEQRPCSSDAQCVVFDDATACGADGYCFVPDPGACRATADCRRQVGFGSHCVDGRCEDVDVPDRCGESSYPEDLWEDLDAHRERLVFGMLADHSTIAHQQREHSVELALEQINEQRAIDGRLFGLVFCDVHGGPEAPYADGLARPDAAVAAAEWLVGTLQVPAVIGAPSSGDTTRVFAEVVKPRAGRTVLMTPSGTSPSLTSLDPPDASDESPGLLWRSTPSASQQGLVIAEHMAAREDRDITRVAILHEDAAFGLGVAAAFGEAWTEKGGSFNLSGYRPGSRADLLEKIAALGEDLEDYQAVLVLTQVGESRIFMAAATDDENYPDDLPIYFGDTGANREIFADAANNRLFDNVLAATPQPADTFVYDAYSDEFMERWGVDPIDFTFTPNAYDAAWLLALGAAWATYQGDGALDARDLHEVNGINIARGLRKTTGGATPIPFIRTEWPSGLSQLMAGRAIDVSGASGQHDWDLSTEEATGSTALLQADSEGHLRVISVSE